MKLRRPKCLSAGDTIATVSVSHGWAGEPDMIWSYQLGKKRLEEMFGLKVVAAPNSMKGFEYLKNNPQARAEDIMWSFENKEVNAIIANIGGNDSIKVVPFIDRAVIRDNPKILIGCYVMNIHLLCHKAGITSFYGHNLLPTIAESRGLHRYSEKWFRKTLFDTSAIGKIEPSENWTYEPVLYGDKGSVRNYYPNSGYELIQGQGIMRGRLFGGHTGIAELEGEPIALSAEDFGGAILFVEDIPEFFAPQAAAAFFRWLGDKGFLQKLNGVIIGKPCEGTEAAAHGKAIRDMISNEFGLPFLPVLYGLNFGHSSPSFLIPYGVEAEIDCESKSFTILEAGVV